MNTNELPPLDAKLELWKSKISPWQRDAIIEVTDTLGFCWAGAQQVFGEKATPEQALAMLPIALSEAARAKARILSQFGRNTESGELLALPEHPER